MKGLFGKYCEPATGNIQLLLFLWLMNRRQMTRRQRLPFYLITADFGAGASRRMLEFAGILEPNEIEHNQRKTR
jgi:hypothetical protein